MKQWPEDGPVDLESIGKPIEDAIKFAYTLKRKNEDKDIPYKGYEIGESMRANSLLAKDKLKAEYLEDRDVLENIVELALQLGVEQGRRILTGENKSKKLLVTADLLIAGVDSDVINRVLSHAFGSD